MNVKHPSKTIVFIHGLFMNPKSWEAWITFFESKGYKCYAPAYAFHEGEPAHLRNNIEPGLGNVILRQIIDRTVQFIDKLPEKKDHIIPSTLNKKNFEAYNDQNSKIDFKEFPNRTHYICGQPDWEEVAEYIDSWIANLHINK
ncbi:MAG: hypothetical protein M0R39_05055 [Prolixibacteraceae bacterium]|jgi:alpha-beta hydrolase superfamily lysophospholipase|nr:hypothetical protein [Prolixibacteraceae bacterium]